MLTAHSVVRRADRQIGQQPTTSVALDYDHRNRRRLTLECRSGETVLLDLARPGDLQPGDLLVLDGEKGLVEIEAEPEALMEITATDTQHLVRLAWHLGNRHLPTELADGKLFIRHDHVIADMVEKLGGKVVAVSRAFSPEGGAYGHGRTHSHDH